MDRRTLVLAVAIGALSGLAGALWSRGSSPAAAPAEARRSSAAASASSAFPAELGGRGTVSWEAPVEVKVVRHGSATPNAEVLLWRLEAGGPDGRWVEAGGARSDADGLARFVTQRGPHLMLAKADGVQVTRVETIASARAPQRFELDLGFRRELSGRVVDAKTKQPIPGAQVRFSSTVEAGPKADPVPEATGVTSADSFGRFSASVGEGRLEVVVRAARYSKLTERVDEDEAGPLTLELEPAGAIEGVVVNVAGFPVLGATVRSEPSDGFSVVTGEDGQFLLQVPAGQVTVDAASPAGRHALQRLRAAAGEVTRGVRLVIDEGVAVEGRVVDADSKAPVGGAAVELLSEPDGLLLAESLATAAGSFRFMAIPRGQYSVRARAGHGARGERIGVQVPADPLEIAMRPSASLKGRVVDADGRPLEGADVEVGWPGGLREAPQRATSGEDGTFSLDELLPAEVTVTGKLGNGAARELRTYLAPGVTAEVTLTLLGQGQLSGVVHGKGGPYEVSVLGDSRRVADRVTSKDGEFSVELPAGSYWVIAVPKGQGMWFAPSPEVVVKPGATTHVEVMAQSEPDSGSRHSFFTTPEMGISFDNVAGNVEISWLSSESPAYLAGLRVGDVVLAIGGQPVNDSLAAFARARGEGGDVKYLVRRGGADQTLTVSR